MGAYFIGVFYDRRMFLDKGEAKRPKKGEKKKIKKMKGLKKIIKSRKPTFVKKIVCLQRAMSRNNQLIL